MVVEKVGSNSMANISGLRGPLWWMQWAKRGWSIAAVGFAVFVFALSVASYYRSSEPESNTANAFHRITTSDLIDLTLLHSAKDRGALCLDGSLPGYHFQKGFGSGAKNWLLFIEGGGWCNTIESCILRKHMHLGSSKHMGRRVHFTGILSPYPDHNPGFFNWNRVRIQYCDGAFIAGHPDNELKNGTELFFRGRLIWEAIMDELSSFGLSKAEQALLSGCSSGGLAALIHCDEFRHLLPKDATVKCLGDASFFLDEKDVLHNPTMRSLFRDVVNLQGLAKSLNKDCVARMEPERCIFPEEMVKNIKTPVFHVQSAYDFWQIQNTLIPKASDPHSHWQKCRLNIYNCNSTQVEILLGFRGSLLKALNEFEKNKGGGMFISSCFIHCQTLMTEMWHSPKSLRINNKTIAESVGDWYFNRSAAKLIDCPFPCNPTCYNVNFTRGSGPFFRGQLIWEAVMDELLSIGLSKVKPALLSGCSAGGLATLIHCDDFQRLLPKDATVKCPADAGFFLDEEDVLQHRTMRSFYNDVAILQCLSKSLHKDCLSRMEPAKCLFPEEVIKYINTPVFLVNPAYDFWQVQHILIPEAADPHGYWRKCKLNIHNCNPSQLKTLDGSRDSMLKALTELKKKYGGRNVYKFMLYSLPDVDNRDEVDQTQDASNFLVGPSVEIDNEIGFMH